MRNPLLVVGSIIALVGSTGSAKARPTIDLIWLNSKTAVTSVLTSSSATLQVILTAGPEGSAGAGVSVDYSVAPLVAIGYASIPGGPLPLFILETMDTGSRVEGINALSFSPRFGTGLSAGQSWQLGTVTFDTTGLEGVFVLSSDASGPGEGVLDIASNDITTDTIFNFAAVVVSAVPVPEPSMLAQITAGLCGLYVMGRKRRLEVS